MHGVAREPRDGADGGDPGHRVNRNNAQVLIETDLIVNATRSALAGLEKALSTRPAGHVNSTRGDVAAGKVGAGLLEDRLPGRRQHARPSSTRRRPGRP